MNAVVPHDSWSTVAVGAPRDMPASVEAEQCLLGAILINQDAFALAASILKPEHFSAEIHQRIFDVMGQMLANERRITVHGLLAFLGDHVVEDDVTTQRYLAMLASSATAVINAPDYARTVRDMAVRRALIGAARQLEATAFDAKVDAPPDEIAAASFEGLRAIVEEAPRQRSRFQIGQGMAELVERVERIRRGEEKHRGMSTGYPDLDRALGGLKRGTIVVLAGRVGMGKTIGMTNLATNVARRNEATGVLEFSLEIPADEIQARHLSAAVFDHRRPVPFSAIQIGDVDDRDMERLVDAQRDFLGLPVVVECPPRITVAEIAARIHVEKKAMAARGISLGVVLIDYLDKIETSDRYAGQRTYEIQETITVLKAAARAEDVCLVLLCQLLRAPDGREDKRPTLADLKSSSFIEQEAHAVIFVYREAYYLQKSTEFREQEAEALARFDKVQHVVEFILGKNRGGPEITVYLWGDVACSVFTSRDWEGRA